MRGPHLFLLFSFYSSLQRWLSAADRSEAAGEPSRAHACHTRHTPSRLSPLYRRHALPAATANVHRWVDHNVVHPRLGRWRAVARKVAATAGEEGRESGGVERPTVEGRGQRELAPGGV